MIDVANIVLIDTKEFEDFYPFSILHPLWELRTGALRTFERYQLQFPKSKLHYYARNNILDSFLFNFPQSSIEIESGKTLILDSTFIMNKVAFQDFNDMLNNSKEENFAISFQGKRIANVISKTHFQKHPELLSERLLSDLDIELYRDFPVYEIKSGYKLNYIWDILGLIAEMIKYDNELINYEETKNGVYYGEKVQIAEFVHFDTEKGPIIIDSNTKVMPFSYLQGPLYIGKNSLVKAHSKIYGETSIGEWCKIAGEIENTVIQSFSNKQHEGFLGHSYLGEWINLGADTNNSDLKNTYSNIKVTLRNKRVDTKRMFMGLIAGDHTKTAINTAFNTGTVTGIFSNIFAEGLTKTSIKSFEWYGNHKIKRYNIDEAVELAKTVMKRRNQELNKYAEELIRDEYQLSQI